MRTAVKAVGRPKDLEKRAANENIPPLRFAILYAALGEKDKAFEWLNKSFERRFGPLIYLKVNPIWDNLRADPRFPELLGHVGLAP